MWLGWSRQTMPIAFWWENLLENPLGYRGGERRIILRRSLENKLLGSKVEGTVTVRHTAHIQTPVAQHKFFRHTIKAEKSEYSITQTVLKVTEVY
jgi:hypothetical protein